MHYPPPLRKLWQGAQGTCKRATVERPGSIFATATCNGDITTHYSAAELNELKKAVEKIVDQRVAQTPTLTLLRTTRGPVGKVSEKEKGSASAAR
jgi:hypothetical protein